MKKMIYILDVKGSKVEMIFEQHELADAQDVKIYFVRVIINDIVASNKPYHRIHNAMSEYDRVVAEYAKLAGK